MKPFNLEEAKAGKPVITGCKQPVRFICFDRKHEKYPIVALVDIFNSGTEAISLYSEDGRLANESSYAKDAQTLYMKTEKKTGWIIIQTGNKMLGGTGRIYYLESTAKDKCGFGEIPVKIEWEE